MIPINENLHYEAKIKAFMAIAKNIEKQVEKNHINVAKLLSKALEIELKLFLNNSNPQLGLSKQLAIQHLKNYINSLD